MLDNIYLTIIKIRILCKFREFIPNHLRLLYKEMLIYVS